MAKQLNIAALRAKAAQDAAIITAPDGRDFPVGALSLDAYLGILELEERFEALRTKEKGSEPDRQAQRDIFLALCDMVTALVPGFPAGQLQMSELFDVLTFVQTANTPPPPAGEDANASEGGGTSGLGESTGPS